MINSHKIKAAINKESDAICKLLLHSFNKIISDKNNFEFIKKRELKILETMFENSEGYYVYSFEEFNHTYGFDKIDTYFDYAIRDIYPNQKLYEKLQHWRDDLPYTNGWALIFGAWKYYNHLIKLKNFDNLELTDQNIQVSIKLDSIKNY